MKFLYPYILILLVFVPFFGIYIRQSQKTHFEGARLWGATPAPYSRSRPYLLSAALACLITALARPASSPEIINTKEMSQDAVFLVDVSRSMETRDQNGQSRLNAVKQALTDLVPFLGTDRVALAAFAGTSVPKCPLTDDYAFFTQSVQLLDTASASRGGTLLGDALRAVKKYYKVPGKHLTVWVFTDGGDQESFPVEAARSLDSSSEDSSGDGGDTGAKNSGGISLYIWGTGTVQGGKVPERNITSVLNEDLLRETAQAVKNGRYFGTEYPLWKFQPMYQSLRKPSAMNETKTVVRDDKGWYLLWPALILLCIDALYLLRLSHRAMRKTPSTDNNANGPRKPSGEGKTADKPLKTSADKKGKKFFTAGSAGIMLFLAVLLISSMFTGCSKPNDDAWKSPADEKQITSLAHKLLENQRNNETRARLFFLWGQELAEKDPAKAAQAFASVIDAGTILADEARINYELLMNQQQQQQDHQNSSDQNEKSDKDEKNDQNGGQGDQNKGDNNGGQSGEQDKSKQNEQPQQQNDSSGSGEQSDQKNQAGQKDQNEQSQPQDQSDQNDSSGSADQQPRDMSSFVRSKEEQAPFDEALKAEMQRQSQKQQLQSNQAVPLDKDW